MRRWIGIIWKLCEGERGRYALAVAALLAASLLLYLAPLVPQVVIDGVIFPDEEADSGFVGAAIAAIGGRDFVRENLWWPALLVLALTGLAGGFTYLRGRFSAQACESVVRRVRDRLYDQLQHLPCSSFDRLSTGDLIQRCTSDVETLRVFLSTQVVEIGRAVVMLLMPIPLMLAIDVRMTVLSVILIPPIIVFSLLYFRRIKVVFRRADEAEARLTTTVQENLTGIRVVRAFARQAFEAERFEVRNTEHRDLDYRLYVLLARFWSFSDLLCLSQKGLVVGGGVYWLATGTLRVGAFFYFITAVSLFIWPVRQMGRILTDLGKALVALGRLREIFEESRESAPPATALARVPATLAGRIVFDDVSFSHAEESPVLDRVSFAVAPGETLAILGPSGCGKSTIVNLLLRFYDADRGTIRLDEHDLAMLPRSFVRGQMAVVMQEPFLYSKSLRDNLTLARPGATEEEMIDATSVACVHDAIVDFEHGYDTRVGERGVTLSGGQRQRVALARALLQRPAILILDDALSAVDADTETMILRALRERHGRHTTIVIAHRLSTLRHADRILVLDEGRIVQTGTHAGLVAESGLYRRLWEIQTTLDTPAAQTTTVATGAPADRPGEGGGP